MTSGLKFITPWAPGASYPAGALPWSATAIKTPPAYTYFTPGVPPGAQEMNSIFNGITVNLEADRVCAIAAAIANWSPLATAGTILSSSTIRAMKWDPFNQRWIVGLSLSGGLITAFQSYDGGSSWNSFAVGWPASGAAVFALATNPTTGDVVAIGTDAAGVAGVYSGATCSTFATQATMVGATAAAAVCMPGSVQPYPTAYVVVQSSTTYTGRLTEAGNAVGSGTWSNISLAGAPNFLSGTNHTGLILATHSTLASDITGSSRAMFAMGGVTAGVDTARLLLIYENGAVGPTEVTFAALAGKLVTGIHYDAATDTWGVLACDPVNAFFYTSPDPTAGVWTLKHTFTVTPSGGLSSVGGVWVAQVGAVHRTVYSGDGGVTWSTARGGLITGSTEIVASEGQMIAWSGTAFSPSNVAAFTSGGGI